MKTQHTILKSVLATLMLAASARAEYFADTDPVAAGNQPGSIYIPLSLGGSTVSEGWEALTSAAYPGNGSFPGLGAWTGALLSQSGPDFGTNGLAKIANGVGGGPYPASTSIYFGGVSSLPNILGGTLEAQATGTGVLSGVKTVVFHLDIGEAWTYDLYNRAAPVLHVTTAGGTTTINPTYSSRYAKVYNGQVLMNGVWEDLYINSRAYQYNLNGVSGTITGLRVRFQGAQHAQVHGLGLQQSTDIYTTDELPTAVP
ncbi:hypothetical protein [Luteolibacter sp. Populi]|uniref:hypothetical protein n=1 Tax=Luteolibacter sp. Populi TaxID=3230487 RepID=UPI00346686A4